MNRIPGSELQADGPDFAAVETPLGYSVEVQEALQRLSGHANTALGLAWELERRQGEPSKLKTIDSSQATDPLTQRIEAIDAAMQRTLQRLRALMDQTAAHPS